MNKNRSTISARCMKRCLVLLVGSGGHLNDFELKYLLEVPVKGVCYTLHMPGRYMASMPRSVQRWCAKGDSSAEKVLIYIKYIYIIYIYEHNQLYCNLYTLNDFGKRMQRIKQHLTCLDAVSVDTTGFFDDIDHITILVNACCNSTEGARAALPVPTFAWFAFLVGTPSDFRHFVHSAEFQTL